MNQKDAVYEAVKQLKPNEVDSDTPVTLTKQEKRVVEDKLFEGFKRKKIQYNNELPSEDKLALYVSGLVSNWLRKDRRLNGNTTYTPKRPGARSSAPSEPLHLSPEQLQALIAGGKGQVVVIVSSGDKDDGSSSTKQ